MAVVPVKNGNALFALSARGELYVDGRKLADDCTSFAVHDSFVLATTHRWAFHEYNHKISLYLSYILHVKSRILMFNA